MAKLTNAVPIEYSQECSLAEAFDVAQKVADADSENVEYKLKRISGNDAKGQYFVQCEARIKNQGSEFFNENCGILLHDMRSHPNEWKRDLRQRLGDYPNP